MKIEIILGTFLTSFIFTFILTKRLIPILNEKGFLTIDRNKLGEKKIPSLGGIAISIGITLGLLFGIGITFEEGMIRDATYLLASLGTVQIMSFLGLLDDLFHVKRFFRVLMPLVAALPLMVVRAGHTDMVLPFIGTIDLGILFIILIIPIAIMGSSNAFNILGGLNGLEAGLGSVIGFSMFICALIIDKMVGIIISLTILGSCLAFFYFNKFPAKIFLDNSGTYTIGAAIGSAAIAGYLESVGAILFIPYFIELFLKARTGFEGECYGIPDEEGFLRSPSIESLTHVIMSIKRLREDQVVYALLLLEAVFGLVAIGFTYHRWMT